MIEVCRAECMSNIFHSFSGFTLLFFLCFTLYYVGQVIHFVRGISRLVAMYRFYTYLLDIPDVSLIAQLRNITIDASAL